MSLLRYEVDDSGTDLISLEEAKKYLKINNTSEDDFIQILIESVLWSAERKTGYSLHTAQWSAYAMDFEYCFEINKSNIETIDGITYVLNDVAEVVDPATYYFFNDGRRSYLMPKEGYSWPTTVDEIDDAVRIQFTTSIHHRYPEIKIQALKHLAHAFENRGDDGSSHRYGLDEIKFYDGVGYPVF